MLDRSRPPKTKGFGHLQIPRPRILRLDNGIPLTVIDQGSQEVNRLTMMWNGGSFDVDSPCALMLAANLLREGSRNLSSAEIAELLDYNGAWLKSEVSSHHASLVLHTLNSKFEAVLPAVVESILYPTFPQKEFEINREKLACKCELDRKKVSFYSTVESNRMIFGKSHPAAHVDTPRQVRETSAEELKKLHSSVFVAGGCALFLAGRITPQMEDCLNDRFGSIRSSSPGMLQRVIPIAPSRKRFALVQRPESLQSALTFAIPTIKRSDPDYVDLRHAVMALGGYFGSRLMSNIREEKGYTYGITAGLMGNWECGVIVISTQCDNRYVQDLIVEVKKEISRMASDDFTDSELDRLKKFAMTQLASTLDSPFSTMDYYENIKLSRIPEDYFEQQQLSLAGLTSGRIALLAGKYLREEELRIAVAGNLPDFSGI